MILKLFPKNLLAFVNKAAMNMGEGLFEVLFSTLLDKCPEMGLLDLIIVPFLTFWGSFMLFSITATPFYIPTNIG